MTYFKNQYATVTYRYCTSSLPQITEELLSINLFQSSLAATDFLFRNNVQQCVEKSTAGHINRSGLSVNEIQQSVTPEPIHHIEQGHFVKICSDFVAGMVALETSATSNFSGRTLPQFKANDSEFHHDCPPQQSGLVKVFKIVSGSSSGRKKSSLAQNWVHLQKVNFLIVDIQVFITKFQALRLQQKRRPPVE